LSDGVEARVGVPEGLFARLREVALCVFGFHLLLRVGRRVRMRLLPGGCDGFAGSARDVLGREVDERYEYEEESEGGVVGRMVCGYWGRSGINERGWGRVGGRGDG
jgi:hypothetical protein